MRICDKCKDPKRKVRRLVKIKDLLFGKGFKEFDLCEQCYKEMMNPILPKPQ